METTFVRYTKFDGALHWNHPVLYLGEDEYGVWVGVSAGQTLLRNTTPKTLTYKFVMLFPINAGFTACYNSLPNRTELYCDVTSTPVFSDGEVTMVDLDLDVVRYRDGSVALLDEDEFDEHQVKYGYPPTVIESALETTKYLLSATQAREEPFGDVYRKWLALVP
ncbi:MAG: DUF402 domain-containing protein [Longispora sp.]|nr:DUF402 domain-containing protein [Longispora sp. (in: high G+C Gram-positive bacteria)]